jgi:hypothetical protein
MTTIRRLGTAALAAFSIATTAASSSCLATNDLEPLPPGGIHVLFVGNSLTYVNDLPGMVAALGSLTGDTIRVATAAEPDLAIIDHWNGQSNARAQIAFGGWQFVILQQGSSSLPLSRDTLVLGAQLFAPSIRAAGAKPALLMVWPSSDRLAFFDDVRNSYQQAATAVGGVFMPAGEAWRRAWAVDSSFQFFGGDGYHPSPVGTLAAALVVYERVTGRDARSLTVAAIQARLAVGISDTQVRELLAAAHDANGAYP